MHHLDKEDCLQKDDDMGTGIAVMIRRMNASSKQNCSLVSVDRAEVSQPNILVFCSNKYYITRWMQHC